MKKKPQSTTRQVMIWLLSASLILVVGLVDGYQTNRWGRNQSLVQAGQALEQLPPELGDWKSKSLEISEQALRIAGATNYVSRLYTNKKSDVKLQVTLLVGDHGPISLHPPTVCFTGAGWRQLTEPIASSYSAEDESPESFWKCQFQRDQDFGQQTIVTEWSWSEGQSWQANENPRFEHAGAPYLFKLYVTRTIPPGEDSESQLHESFVKLLLEQIKETVFSTLSATND
ncbi:MAG: exosortase-associated EpsI family protein [Planctomycetaceae bacterium]|nr:exosortase-associated EpsI family protein [Planctomycetaceae bacterium]